MADVLPPTAAADAPALDTSPWRDPHGAEDESFSLTAILNKAALRHSTAMEAESVAAAAAATSAVEERNKDQPDPHSHSAATTAEELLVQQESMSYVETNIRGWLLGQESQQWKTLLKLVKSDQKEVYIAERSSLAHREGEQRQGILSEESSEVLKLAEHGRDIKRLHVQHCQEASAVPLDRKDSCNAVGRGIIHSTFVAFVELEDAMRQELLQLEHHGWRAISEAYTDEAAAIRERGCEEAALAAAVTVWVEDMRQLLINEANVRYTLETLEHRDRAAMTDMVEELTDEIVESEADARRRAMKQGVVNSPQREEEEVERGPWRRFMLTEANIRFTVEMSERKDRVALREVMAHMGGEDDDDENDDEDSYHSRGVSNADVERKLEFAGGSVQEAASHTHSAAVVGEHREYSPPREFSVAPLQLDGVPDWLLEDEAAGRRDVAEEWLLDLDRINEGVKSYLAVEYDWVLAGYRRVVRADQDMFRTQKHIPGALRAPQKHFFHERLGLLERCMADVLAEQHQAAVGSSTSPHTKPASPPLGSLRNRSPMSSRAAEEASSHGRVQHPVSSKSKQSPQRAVNDSLLQSLLYQERAGRGLLERDSEQELTTIAQQCFADLHWEYSWSMGWCFTESAKRAPRPSSHQERHLPTAFRIGSDPKPVPKYSPRPPAEHFLTPQRSHQQGGSTADTSANKALEDVYRAAASTVPAGGTLRLPVPPRFLERVKSARPNHHN